VKVGDKAFLFLRQREARLKLGASLAEAAALAKKAPERCEAGKGGWVKVVIEDDDVTPLALLQRWVKESYALLAPKTTAAPRKRG
jgi:hypothetical protein